MTTALEEGEWSATRPGRTLPSGKTRYQFYRRLGGPQGLEGRKISSHRDSIPDCPARSQSLYRLSYQAHIYGYIHTYVHRVIVNFRNPKFDNWYLLGMNAMQLNWWMNMLVRLCRIRAGTSTGNVTWHNLSSGFKIVRLSMLLYNWSLSSISILFCGGYLKENVYKSKPRALYGIKQNVQYCILNVTRKQ